jgi:hypothetical protein
MTLRALVAVLACLLVAAHGAAAAAQVSMSQTHVTSRIGEDFHVASTIANPTSARLSGLIAHLDVVGRDPDVYVDPEDWSSERTRYLPPIAAGVRVRIPWTVKAVNAGRFDVYVVVLGTPRPTTGPAVDVRVAQRTAIDRGGALPLAVGIPALLGLALVGVRLRRAR